MASLAFGVGELTMLYRATDYASKAYRIYRLTKSMMDLGVSVGDVTISNNLTNSFTQAQQEQWSQFSFLYFTASLSAEGAEALLRWKGKKITQAGEFETMMDEVLVSRKARLLDKLNNLPDAKNFVNSLDDVADAELLTRIDRLSDAKLEGLDKFYKNLKSNTPAGFGNNDYNFIASKEIEFTGTTYINGVATPFSNTNNVSLSYKNGFPEFHKTNYCPTMNFSGEASGKFKYVNNNLSTSDYSNHFKLANEELAKKFGKGTNSWPSKNADGFHEIGDYRWDGLSPQFELKASNGVWEKYTWHHFEDGKTIIPVLSSVHSPGVGGFKHAGGNKILEFDFKGVFEFSGF